MEPLISLDRPEEETPIVLDNSPAQAITPETAEKRSFKVDYALGKTLGKTREEIFQDIQDGREEELRASAAGSIKLNRLEETTKTVAELIANKPDMTPQESQGVLDLVKFANKEVDPGSVFEESYAKKLVSEMDRYAETHPESSFAKAKKDNPQEINQIQERASEYAAKREYANTLLSNIQDEVKQQGYIGYGIDIAKQLVPGYTDLVQRGIISGVGITAGGTLSGNIDKQRQALFGLPFDEFKKKLTQDIADLRGENPQMAAMFLHDLIGQNTSEAAMSNIALPLDVAGTGLATALGKTARGAAKRIAMSDARKAAADVVEAGTQPNTSRSTIAEGVGDLKEAAVIKSTTSLTEQIRGATRATEEAVEALTKSFRTDMAQFREGAAKAGTSRELTNRVMEHYDTVMQKAIRSAGNTGKVDRIPGVLDNETAVRELIDDIADLYPTMRNSILETDIRKEPISNSVLAEMHLGKNDGTYFSSRTVAENFIKFHKLNDATIETGKNEAKAAKVYYLPESAVKTVSGEANPNFGYKIQDGKPTFYSDITNEVEVLPSPVAKKGFIPVDVEGQNATFGKPVATVEQQGLGYYVRLTVPVPENSSVMRDFIAETGHTKMPDSPLRNFVTSILGEYRTPEEVLSQANRQNRLAVTYGPSVFIDMLKDNVKGVQKLSTGRFSGKDKKKRWEEFQRMLAHAEAKIDPETGVPGYFYKSPEDMSTDWVQVLGRLPEEQEIAAYFDFKASMEVDRMFRNISAHSYQQRVGAMTNHLTMTDEAGNVIKSNEFSGIAKRDFPGGDGNILIIDEKGNQRIAVISRISSDDKKEFSNRVKQGELRVVEVFDPEKRPLSGFGKVTDERIQYVMSPTIETRALDWNQIPRRGGGHLQYDYDFWVKQAKIHHDKEGNRFWYEGDISIVPLQFQSMGKEVAGHLDRVRLLFRAKDIDGAQAYATTHLPFDWDIVKGWFEGVNGRPPMLNLREPIQVVGRGESIIGKDKNLERRYSRSKGDGRFKDGTKQNSLARQQQIEFSGERDSYNLLSIEDVGTRGNPLYKAVPAKTIDPITAMQRGLQRIIKSNFFNDYKTMSVEHWLKEAAPYLEANDAKIKYSPFYYYNEAKFKPDAPADVVKRLNTAKYQIDQIVGIPSETDNLLYQYSQKVSDFAYRHLGPKAPAVTASWLLPKLRDPFAFMRSMVFHPTMGLFNIPQFAVQMANYGNIYGIAGHRFASPGALGAQLHFWTRANSHPNIIAALDKKASQFNMPGISRWRPGEFTEAFEELHNTGFGVVGREHAWLDDPMSTKVFHDTKTTFLDWGTVFFRGGEQNARMGAWYTAYREFRDKKPFGRITDADRASILQRADILNINMSRASATAINRGWKSVPMQFFSYNQRLFSLFFSGRISPAERAKLLAWNAALYGLPATAGVTGIPVVDYLRKIAIDDFNYVVGDNAIESLFMEGIPSTLAAMATGGGDPTKGTYLDFGQRFATKGLEFIGGLGTPDKSFLDIVGGPSYRFAKSTYAATDGLRRVILDMVTLNNDPDSSMYVTPEHFIDPLRSISSVNSVFRLIAATEYGRFMTRNDAFLAETTPTQAVIAGILGLKDQRINDLQLKNAMIKARKDYQNEVEKSFQQDFRRGMLAHKNGNHAEGEKHLHNATVWLKEVGGFRPDQIHGIMGKALDDNRSILQKVDGDYYIRKAPADQIEDKLKAFQRTLEIQQNKAK